MKLINKEDHLKSYSGDDLFWGAIPNKYVARLKEYISLPANILDLGAGEGRNSVFLSKEGFSVTAVDINEKGLNKIRKIAESSNLDISCNVSDISTYPFNETYDGIICNAVLHFIDETNIRRVISSIQEHTKKDGINILTVFSVDDPGVAESPECKFFSDKEIKEYYKDWRVEVLEHYQKHETHGQPHDHDFIALIARKI